ncbi:MAG: phenylacetic acid degradation operon negative regulatory protein [Cellvibrionaceae bacterium]|jgi:phenylacetic acid degradation operon negative regulatory protein
MNQPATPFSSTTFEMLNHKHNSKFFMLVLFGDYIRHRDNSIRMADLLYLLGLLGIGEHTGRSTINRMVREGWFTVEKEGRNSKFSVTEKGENILQGGDLRLNEIPTENWDRTWHMVAYSLPEEKRKRRNDLRKQLTWLGYGSLGPGLWISPNNRRAELETALKTFDVQDHVNIFSGDYWGPLSTQELVAQCWNLPVLADEYRRFNDFYESDLAEFKKIGHHSKPAPSTKAPVKAPVFEEECFVRRFMLPVRLFPILQKDPNLPLNMLPKDWPGITGRKLFTHYRNLLTPIVDPFIDQVVAGERQSS